MEQDTKQELSEALAKLKRAELENKKLTRQVTVLQNTLDRHRSALSARTSLGAIISAEKSKQEKYMDLLLENSPDIILLFDQRGRFAYCTDAFLKRANIQTFGMIDGRTYQEVFRRFADDLWIARIERAFEQAFLEKRTVRLDEEVDIARDGNVRTYNIHITPMFDEQGMPGGSLAFLNDLTDILHAKRMAEQANNAKSDFLATVSHEIRTPMNAIIGISDIMKRTELTAQQVDYLHSIQSSSHVLLNLINDILDFSKIEAGKLELVEDYFSLPGLLEQVKDMFTIMLGEKRIEFETCFDGRLPSVVKSDEKRLRQVLTNILNNAVKYTNEGKITFRAYCNEQGFLCFDVKDTGIGIKQEDIPKLFTPFEQLDKVRNKNVVGTGLGLAITHRLCELMHGSIAVSSEYGKGSCFSIWIHPEVGSEEDLPEEEAPILSFTAPDANVLLVDDIEINLMVAAAMLEPYQVKITQVLSGKEAIALVNEKRFDLIYMDHMMPEMDGIEATGTIRALGGPAKDIPIVALTANAVSGAKEMFIANGFSDFLSKPINPGALAASLLKWLPHSYIITKRETM